MFRRTSATLGDGATAGFAVAAGAGTAKTVPHFLHSTSLPTDCSLTAYFFRQPVHSTVKAIPHLKIFDETETTPGLAC
jgi:hypothetical protein